MVKYTTLNRVTGNELVSKTPQCIRMMDEFMYRHNPSNYRPVKKTKHKSLIAEPVHVIYDDSHLSCDDGQIYNRPSKRPVNMLTKLAYR